MWIKASLNWRIGDYDYVTGNCNRCGQCCLCLFYGLSPRLYEEKPCPELDTKTKRCMIYERRPDGCRSFPALCHFLFGAVPEGCGYKVARGV